MDALRRQVARSWKPSLPGRKYYIMEKQTFAELGLSPELLKAIEAQGFEQPSPIQAQAIPVALTGRDVVGQSMTGSGKTLAVGLQAVQRIDNTSRATQTLMKAYEKLVRQPA